MMVFFWNVTPSLSWMRKGGKGKNKKMSKVQLNPPNKETYSIKTFACFHFCLLQMGHPANPRAAHVPALAAAHEQEEGDSRVWAGALLLLPRHRGWYGFPSAGWVELHLDADKLTLNNFCVRQLKPSWSLPSCQLLLLVGHCPSCHKSKSQMHIVFFVAIVLV